MKKSLMKTKKKEKNNFMLINRSLRKELLGKRIQVFAFAFIFYYCHKKEEIYFVIFLLIKIESLNKNFRFY